MFFEILRWTNETGLPKLLKDLEQDGVHPAVALSANQRLISVLWADKAIDAPDSSFEWQTQPTKQNGSIWAFSTGENATLPPQFVKKLQPWPGTPTATATTGRLLGAAWLPSPCHRKSTSHGIQPTIQLVAHHWATESSSEFTTLPHPPRFSCLCVEAICPASEQSPENDGPAPQPSAQDLDPRHIEFLDRRFYFSFCQTTSLIRHTGGWSSCAASISRNDFLQILAERVDPNDTCMFEGITPSNVMESHSHLTQDSRLPSDHGNGNADPDCSDFTESSSDNEDIEVTTSEQEDSNAGTPTGTVGASIEFEDYHIRVLDVTCSDGNDSADDFGRALSVSIRATRWRQAPFDGKNERRTAAASTACGQSKASGPRDHPATSTSWLLSAASTSSAESKISAEVRTRQSSCQKDCSGHGVYETCVIILEFRYHCAGIWFHRAVVLERPAPDTAAKPRQPDLQSDDYRATLSALKNADLDVSTFSSNSERCVRLQFRSSCQNCTQTSRNSHAQVVAWSRTSGKIESVRLLQDSIKNKNSFEAPHVVASSCCLLFGQEKFPTSKYRVLPVISAVGKSGKDWRLCFGLRKMDSNAVDGSDEVVHNVKSYSSEGVAATGTRKGTFIIAQTLANWLLSTSARQLRTQNSTALCSTKTAKVRCPVKPWSSTWRLNHSRRFLHRVGRAQTPLHSTQKVPEDCPSYYHRRQAEHQQHSRRGNDHGHAKTRSNMLSGRHVVDFVPAPFAGARFVVQGSACVHLIISASPSGKASGARTVLCHAIFASTVGTETKRVQARWLGEESGATHKPCDSVGPVVFFENVVCEMATPHDPQGAPFNDDTPTPLQLCETGTSLRPRGAMENEGVLAVFLRRDGVQVWVSPVDRALDAESGTCTASVELRQPAPMACPSCNSTQRFPFTAATPWCSLHSLVRYGHTTLAQALHCNGRIRDSLRQPFPSPLTEQFQCDDPDLMLLQLELLLQNHETSMHGPVRGALESLFRSADRGLRYAAALRIFAFVNAHWYRYSSFVEFACILSILEEHAQALLVNEIKDGIISLQKGDALRSCDTHLQASPDVAVFNHYQGRNRPREQLGVAPYSDIHEALEAAREMPLPALAAKLADALDFARSLRMILWHSIHSTSQANHRATGRLETHNRGSAMIAALSDAWEATGEWFLPPAASSNVLWSQIHSDASLKGRSVFSRLFEPTSFQRKSVVLGQTGTVATTQPSSHGTGILAFDFAGSGTWRPQWEISLRWQHGFRHFVRSHIDLFLHPTGLTIPESAGEYSFEQLLEHLANKSPVGPPPSLPQKIQLKCVDCLLQSLLVPATGRGASDIKPTNTGWLSVLQVVTNMNFDIEGSISTFSFYDRLLLWGLSTGRMPTASVVALCMWKTGTLLSIHQQNISNVVIDADTSGVNVRPPLFPLQKSNTNEQAEQSMMIPPPPSDRHRPVDDAAFLSGSRKLLGPEAEWMATNIGSHIGDGERALGRDAVFGSRKIRALGEYVAYRNLLECCHGGFASVSSASSNAQIGGVSSKQDQRYPGLERRLQAILFHTLVALGCHTGLFFKEVLLRTGNFALRRRLLASFSRLSNTCGSAQFNPISFVQKASHSMLTVAPSRVDTGARFGGAVFGLFDHPVLTTMRNAEEQTPSQFSSLSRFMLSTRELIGLCRMHIVESLHGVRCYTTAFRRQVSQQRIQLRISGTSSCDVAQLFLPLCSSMDVAVQDSIWTPTINRNHSVSPVTRAVSVFDAATGDIPDVGPLPSDHGWHEHAAIFQVRDKFRSPFLQMPTRTRSFDETANSPPQQNGATNTQSGYFAQNNMGKESRASFIEEQHRNSSTDNQPTLVRHQYFHSVLAWVVEWNSTNHSFERILLEAGVKFADADHQRWIMSKSPFRAFIRQLGISDADLLRESSPLYHNQHSENTRPARQHSESRADLLREALFGDGGHPRHFLSGCRIRVEFLSSHNDWGGLSRWVSDLRLFGEPRNTWRSGRRSGSDSVHHRLGDVQQIVTQPQFAQIVENVQFHFLTNMGMRVLTDTLAKVGIFLCQISSRPSRSQCSTTAVTNSSNDENDSEAFNGNLSGQSTQCKPVFLTGIGRPAACPELQSSVLDNDFTLGQLDRTSFYKLLQQLCRVQMLFIEDNQGLHLGGTHEELVPVLPLRDPRNQFHRLMVQTLQANNLKSCLGQYVLQYGLGQSSADSEILLAPDIRGSQPMEHTDNASRYRAKDCAPEPWARFMMAGLTGQPDGIFLASLHCAETLGLVDKLNLAHAEALRQILHQGSFAVAVGTLLHASFTDFSNSVSIASHDPIQLDSLKQKWQLECTENFFRQPECEQAQGSADPLCAGDADVIQMLLDGIDGAMRGRFMFKNQPDAPAQSVAGAPMHDAPRCAGGPVGLHNIRTIENDTSALELLRQHSQFDLQTIPHFSTLMSGDSSDNPAAKSEVPRQGCDDNDGDGQVSYFCMDAGTMPPSSEDVCDFSFFLSKAMPMEAFFQVRSLNMPDTLTGSIDSDVASHDDHDSVWTLPEAVKRIVMREVRHVALRHALSLDVVSACIIFSWLCNLDTEQLRVDIAALRRIHAHQMHDRPSLGKNRSARGRTIQRSYQSSRKGSQNRRRTGSVANAERLLRELADAFIDFEVNLTPGERDIVGQVENRSIKMLQLLGEATRDGQGLPPNLGNSIDAAMGDTQLNKSEFNADTGSAFVPIESSLGLRLALDYPESKWKLVTLFCKAHGLPRSLALLHELARRNDWVLFLHEAEREACDLQVALGVVRRQFKDRALRGHLVSALLFLEDCGRGDLHEQDVTKIAPETTRRIVTTDMRIQLLFELQKDIIAKVLRKFSLLPGTLAAQLAQAGFKVSSEVCPTPDALPVYPSSQFVDPSYSMFENWVCARRLLQLRLDCIELENLRNWEKGASRRETGVTCHLQKCFAQYQCYLQLLDTARRQKNPVMIIAASTMATFSVVPDKWPQSRLESSTQVQPTDTQDESVPLALFFLLDSWIAWLLIDCAALSGISTHTNAGLLFWETQCRSLANVSSKDVNTTLQQLQSSRSGHLENDTQNEKTAFGAGTPALSVPSLEAFFVAAAEKVYPSSGKFVLTDTTAQFIEEKLAALFQLLSAVSSMNQARAELSVQLFAPKWVFRSDLLETTATQVQPKAKGESTLPRTLRDGVLRTLFQALGSVAKGSSTFENQRPNLDLIARWWQKTTNNRSSNAAFGESSTLKNHRSNVSVVFSSRWEQLVAAFCTAQLDRLLQKCVAVGRAKDALAVLCLLDGVRFNVRYQQLYRLVSSYVNIKTTAFRDEQSSNAKFQSPFTQLHSNGEQQFGSRNSAAFDRVSKLSIRPLLDQLTVESIVAEHLRLDQFDAARSLVTDPVFNMDAIWCDQVTFLEGLQYAASAATASQQRSTEALSWIQQTTLLFDKHHTSPFIRLVFYGLLLCLSSVFSDFGEIEFEASTSAPGLNVGYSVGAAAQDTTAAALLGSFDAILPLFRLSGLHRIDMLRRRPCLTVLSEHAAVMNVLVQNQASLALPPPSRNASRPDADEIQSRIEWLMTKDVYNNFSCMNQMLNILLEESTKTTRSPHQVFRLPLLRLIPENVDFPHHLSAATARTVSSAISWALSRLNIRTALRIANEFQIYPPSLQVSVVSHVLLRAHKIPHFPMRRFEHESDGQEDAFLAVNWMAELSSEVQLSLAQSTRIQMSVQQLLVCRRMRGQKPDERSLQAVAKENVLPPIECNEHDAAFIAYLAYFVRSGHHVQTQSASRERYPLVNCSWRWAAHTWRYAVSTFGKVFPDSFSSNELRNGSARADDATDNVDNTASSRNGDVDDSDSCSANKDSGISIDNLPGIFCTGCCRESGPARPFEGCNKNDLVSEWRHPRPIAAASVPLTLHQLCVGMQLACPNTCGSFFSEFDSLQPSSSHLQDLFALVFRTLLCNHAAQGKSTENTRRGVPQLKLSCNKLELIKLVQAIVESQRESLTSFTSVLAHLYAESAVCIVEARLRSCHTERQSDTQLPQQCVALWHKDVTTAFIGCAPNPEALGVAVLHHATDYVSRAPFASITKPEQNRVCIWTLQVDALIMAYHCFHHAEPTLARLDGTFVGFAIGRSFSTIAPRSSRHFLTKHVTPWLGEWWKLSFVNANSHLALLHTTHFMCNAPLLAADVLSWYVEQCLPLDSLVDALAAHPQACCIRSTVAQFLQKHFLTDASSPAAQPSAKSLSAFSSLVRNLKVLGSFQALGDVLLSKSLSRIDASRQSLERCNTLLEHQFGGPVHAVVTSQNDAELLLEEKDFDLASATSSGTESGSTSLSQLKFVVARLHTEVLQLLNIFQLLVEAAKSYEKSADTSLQSDSFQAATLESAIAETGRNSPGFRCRALAQLVKVQITGVRTAKARFCSCYSRAAQRGTEQVVLPGPCLVASQVPILVGLSCTEAALLLSLEIPMCACVSRSLKKHSDADFRVGACHPSSFPAGLQKFLLGPFLSVNAFAACYGLNSWKCWVQAAYRRSLVAGEWDFFDGCVGGMYLGGVVGSCCSAAHDLRARGAFVEAVLQLAVSRPQVAVLEQRPVLRWLSAALLGRLTCLQPETCGRVLQKILGRACPAESAPAAGSLQSAAEGSNEAAHPFRRKIEALVEGYAAVPSSSTGHTAPAL